MQTITRSHILTPALWKALSKQPSQANTPDPLLFLTQGVFHNSGNQGFVKLRSIRELADSRALVSVYIEGTSEVLSNTVSVAEARLYAAPQDIIEQNDGVYSFIFKLISYPEGEAVADIYLWEVPPVLAPEAIESDIALSLPKGSGFFVSPSEEDIVMDRTFRVSANRQVSVNIRTVEGRSYSTTVSQAQAIRCAQPGDYYVENGSDRLSVVYGVTAQREQPLLPVIKYFPLPDTPRSRQNPGV